MSNTSATNGQTTYSLDIEDAEGESLMYTPNYTFDVIVEELENELEALDREDVGQVVEELRAHDWETTFYRALLDDDGETEYRVRIEQS